MQSENLLKLANKLPKSPGVYIYRNEKNKVLYVGKAINLQNRVKSYFSNLDTLTPKTRALVEKIDKIDHIKVENELEALLLEADLIKRYRPPYNINLKDDKFYRYIKIDYTKLDVENGKKKNVYKISTVRNKKDDKASYFGPYPDGSSINLILKMLRRIFPYRDCTTQKFNRYKKAHRPCLYGHIGVCAAPCQSSKGVEQNNANIKKIKEYLSGDRKRLFQRLESEMKSLSKNHEFEKAAVIRDQLASYKYLTQEKRNIKEYIESPSLIEDINMQSLKDFLGLLKKNTDFKFDNNNLNEFRVEIYDISNIQGKNAVGSMVVLTGGTPDKKEYRRFKIQTKDTPDDFAMMQEVLSRRFKRTKSKKAWKLPGLIVIDGGKGQLSSSMKTLNELGVEIPTVGLAKREEEVISMDKGDFKVINIGAKNPALNMVKKGRDEAHRYGIGYYRKVHRRNIYK